MTRKYPVSGDLYKRIDAKMSELKRMLRQKKGCIFDPADLFVALQYLIDGKITTQDLIAVSLRKDEQAQQPAVRMDKLFLSPGEQWSLFLEYNENLPDELRFTKEELLAFCMEGGNPNPPELPEDASPLTVVQLVPYQETVEKTIAFLLGFVQSQMEKLGLNYYQWEGYNDLLTKKDVIRLLPGIEHPRKCLRWEIVDLGANRGKKPCDVRNENSPHAAVLAAAGFHTNWSTSMDGDKIPYVFMPGYQVTVPSGDSWQYVPHIWFHQHDRRLRIGCSWDGYCNQGWAVVVVAI